MTTGHAIRLRAGWEWAHRDDPTGVVPRRISLPTPWPADWDRPVSLRRRFGRPPAPGPTLLRLVQVGGLVAVRLNGVELAVPGPSDLPLPPLAPRNLLVLEVDPARRGGVEGGETWGEVALIVPAAGD